ncbi:intein [Micromonospora sagamiensis]|uniref:Intein n=1 Tax=Micromonospora sagamiensis TaxID=47875 RepID=A0A562WE51_9ACTN|nr:intein [Micromonospora sagamiensis]
MVATDPETGETSAEPVTQLHVNIDRELTNLTVRGSGAERAVTLETTAHHPFWDATDRQWVDAGKLQVGHRLLVHDDKRLEGDGTGAGAGGGGPGREVTVVAVDNFTGSEVMRDLTVATHHTYYVIAGNTPVLVHNNNKKKCGPDNQTFDTRSEARAAAYARAGVPLGREPDLRWEVGGDRTRRGQEGYRFEDNPGTHGNYEQHEMDRVGSRLIVEHTNDPNAPYSHFHAGQPKSDPSQLGVDFGWGGGKEYERYSAIGGSHHMYYRE